MAANSRKFELTNFHLFNIGSGGLLLLGIGLAMQSSFTPKPETPLCEARYAGGVLFSYTRQGAPLTPEDLQARLAGLDRGIVSNARIVKDAAVANGFALEVALKRAKADEDEQARSGIGYTWVPRQLASASAVCLSYNVWVPEDFKPGEGGVLPGLVSDGQSASHDPEQATSKPDPADDSQAAAVKAPPFSMRVQWRNDNTLMLWQVPNIGGSGGIALDTAKAALKPGQWVRIEQEAVLNTPGQTNGTLRTWVNGKLLVERFDIGFRKDDMQSFQAIAGNVHHLRGMSWAPAPAETRLRLSPLELRMR